MIKTINLDGTEQAVKFAGKHTHFHVHSLSGEVLVSLAPNVERGTDGVLIIQSGGAGYVQNDMATDTVYLAGSGEVQVVGSGNAFSPFKVGAEGGGNSSSITEGGTVTGTVNYPIIALNLYGNSVQDGTPTPEVPIDIISVGDDGNVSLTTCGKNFVQYSNASTGYGGITFTLNSDNSITVNGTATSLVNSSAMSTALLLPNGDYIVSGCAEGGTSDTYKLTLRMYKSDGTSKYVNVTKETKVTIDDSITKILLYCEIYEGITANNLVFKPMIRPANIADSTYEPYKGNTATITSGLPLCSIGDVRDELVYNVDGTGKIIKRTAKLDSYNGEAITTDYISSTGGFDTGAEVVYMLENPQETELSAAEITALMKLQTFNGVTHIYNDEGAEMKVKVATNPMFSELIKPVLDGFDKRITSLEAALTAFMEG